MSELSKQQNKQLRQIASMAHERELGKVLSELGSAFDRWENDEVSARELNDRILELDRGALKQIWDKYQRLPAETVVAQGISEGFVQESEVPAEILDHLRKQIQFFSDEMARNDKER